MGEAPQLFTDVARWYAVSTVALGLRTGLLDALMGPAGGAATNGRTAAELAGAAGTDEDATARWADAMVTAGYATKQDGRYAPVDEALKALQPGSMGPRAIVELLVSAGGLLPRTAAAIEDGAGIGSDELQAALGITPERVNIPMYQRLLLSEWIEGHPEIKAALEAGASVAEVGPGGGTALRILAGAFPSSQFRGCDLDPRIVAEANAAAAAEGLTNVSFEVLDARNLPKGAFDLVCMFDAFHHVTDPDGVLAGMRSALRPGGSLLLAEVALSGDPTEDAADPTAVIVYGSDLVYCYQESKVAGRPGMGATWAGRGLDALLARHGFTETGRVTSRGGYIVVRAVPA